MSFHLTLNTNFEKIYADEELSRVECSSHSLVTAGLGRLFLRKNFDHSLTAVTMAQMRHVVVMSTHAVE